MKAFALALLGLVLCATGAAFVLEGLQMSAADAFATSNVRVGDAGENLVE